MNTGQVNIDKVTRDRVASALRAELEFSYGWVEVRRDNHRLIINWTGTPTEEQVAEVVEREAPGVEAKLTRVRIWSCGNPHVDAASAWAWHNLHTGAAGTAFGPDGLNGSGVKIEDLEAVFGGDEELAAAAAGKARWFSDCSCGSTGAEAVAYEDLEQLARDQNISWDGCVDGEYAVCPGCGAHGTLIDVNYKIVTCGTCDGAKVFDLTVESEKTRYQEARAGFDQVRAARSS